MRIIFSLIVVLAAFIAGFQPAAAADDASVPSFFHDLSDIPLPPGFAELPDESLSFDKPEGRIVEAVAAAPAVDYTPASIRLFYSQTLPSLGWKAAGNDSYARQDESLHLATESRENSLILRLRVMPR